MYVHIYEYICLNKLTCLCIYGCIFYVNIHTETYRQTYRVHM